MMNTCHLLQEAEALTELWSPKIVGQVNDQYVKVAKVQGQFTWHQHDEEDELFLVLKGQLVIEYQGHAVTLNEGDMHVVPKGVSHNPRADDVCHLALIETVTTKHTGEVIDPLTRSVEEQLGEA